jgi:light-regulated signal transduction histidine kinase (bacteriophytochrome)
VTWPNRQVNMKVGSGTSVCTDPMLLRVVWNDLLGNAWKFTSKQERAAIEVGTVSHDGLVWAEGQVGQAETFYFTLGKGDAE